MEKLTLTKEAQQELLKKFESRANAQGWKPKSKKRLDAQTEFLVGAVSAIDTLNNEDINTGKSCIPPGWMISMIRGEYILPNE